MAGEILVVYATRSGSTAEVADVIARVLREHGIGSTTSDVRTIKDISGYRGIILGSPVRMGKLMPEMLRFAKRHQGQLKSMASACFSLGVTMNQDTPERRTQAEAYLTPLVTLVQPRRTAVFGGKVDLQKLGFPWSWTLKYVREGDMAPGDHRDFTAIRAWAEELVGLFQVNNQGD